MPRFKQGDNVVTTTGASMSGLRTYPAGTKGRIDTDHRDVGSDGFIVQSAWVRITLPDSSGLYYPQSQLKHAPKKRRTA